ncbi:MAG: SMP-30/gluconolactonase/LRE family protein [Cyclobacteriaceae bacterium]|nr:SMP-30/gluconolactonase/LRE family protein [Cyclobacteriaceae bacterium]
MQKIFYTLVIVVFIGLMMSCQNTTTNNGVTEDTEKQVAVKTIGSIEFIDESFKNLVSKGAKIEVLAEGFEWTEGPLWIEEGGYLLFSDIPPNSIFRWDDINGIKLYLKPSGYTGKEERGGELGSNGLLLNSNDELVLCQHGDRRIAKMDAPLSNPVSKFVTLADTYDEKRFNSPNDAIFHSSGDLYFTDPPYGLVDNVNDSTKEIPFQGVYKLDNSGKVYLLIDSLTRPNGIVFSPDEQKLYVANSDPERAWWSMYNIDDLGNIVAGHIMYDATDLVGQEKGLPDGMAIDSNGNIWATGPGGIFVFNSQGQLIGKLKTGEATANCTFDTQEKYLYITADMYLLRLPLK